MNTPKVSHISKEDLTCAFHKDVEDAQTCIKKRVDFIILCVVVNALLTGAHLALKVPTLF